MVFTYQETDDFAILFEQRIDARHLAFQLG